MDDEHGTDAGAVYIVFGKSPFDGLTKHLEDLPTFGRGAKILGLPGSELGYETHGAGDVNGDGIADILVSSKLGGGTVYVIYGSSSSDWTQPLVEGSFGQAAHTLTAPAADQAPSGFGAGTAGGADLNKDLLCDVAICTNARCYVVLDAKTA